MAWKKANPAAVKEALDEMQSGPPFLKLDSGKKGKTKKTWIRILPPREDHPNDRWFYNVKVHFSVGPNNRSIECLQPHDQVCPVCIEVDRLNREGYDKEAKEMRAQWRAVMNVVEYEDDFSIADDKIKVWAPSRSLVTDIINLTDDLNDDEKDISDPETGRDICVARKGTTRNDVRYDVELEEEPSQFNNGDFELLEDLHDLTTVYVRLEVNRVQKLLTSGFGDEDEGAVVDGEYHEVAKLPAGKKTKKTRTPKPEPEEDDDEEEEEEAPQPAAKKSRPPTTEEEDKDEALERRSPKAGKATRGSTPSSSKTATKAVKASTADADAAKKRLHAILNDEDAEEDEEDGDDEDDD